MPTPARNATAEIGAFGSAVKTSRAASRIRPSFRTAWDCRPGNRGGISSFISRSIHGTKHSVLLQWNGAIRSALAQIGLSPCEGDEAQGDRTCRSATRLLGTRVIRRHLLATGGAVLSIAAEPKGTGVLSAPCKEEKVVDSHG